MARVDNRGNLRGSLQNAGGLSRARSTKGTSDFLALSKALKQAGETGLRKELHKVMRDAAKPVIPKVRDAARESFPSKGGLNERMAKKPFRSAVRTGNATAGVRIQGTKVDPRINNEGRIVHPVFGRTGKAANGGKNAVVQSVPDARGYFDQTISDQAPGIRNDVLNALGDFVNRFVAERR